MDTVHRESGLCAVRVIPRLWDGLAVADMQSTVKKGRGRGGGK